MWLCAIMHDCSFGTFKDIHLVPELHMGHTGVVFCQNHSPWHWKSSALLEYVRTDIWTEFATCFMSYYIIQMFHAFSFIELLLFVC